MPDSAATLTPQMAVAPLAIQARVSEVDLAAELHRRHGFDVVLTASSDRRRDPSAALEEAAERYYAMTGQRAQLDANRYAGKGRRRGSDPLSRQWVDRQVRLGSPRLLVDSGFCNDLAEVATLLDNAVSLEQAVGERLTVVVALPSSILKTDSRELINLVDRSRLDVGLALEHAGDPLSVQYAVRGVLDLVAIGNVHLRRVDLSALGALAFGALGSTIGTTATLRHVYPAASGGRVVSEYPSILIEKALCWRTQDRVMDAAGMFPDHVFWNCPCENCYNRPIPFAVRTEAEVVTHNFSVISRVASNLLASPDPRLSWFAMCQSAQTYAYQVRAESGPGWEPQDFLGAWLSNQPSRVGQ